MTDVLEVVADVVTGVLLLGGAVLTLSAGVALVRFPDLLSRMHAATKPQILGLLMIILGAALQMDSSHEVTGLLLVAAFQLITAPVTAHMVGRSAYRGRSAGRERLLVDELAGLTPPNPTESLDGDPR